MSANPQAAATEPLLLRQDEGGVVTLTLNRPTQFNSLSQALMNELQAELDRISADENVRVVIIAGAGKAFCAGHDLKEMRSNASKAFQQQLFSQCSKLMLTLVRLPQPVIARVHGIATAAGCQLVSMCDLAVASDNARFAVSGINLGLFCSTPSVGAIAQPRAQAGDGNAAHRRFYRRTDGARARPGEPRRAFGAARRGDQEAHRLAARQDAGRDQAGQTGVLPAAGNGAGATPTTSRAKPWPAT